MLRVPNPLGKEFSDLVLPEHTFVAHMKNPEVLSDPKKAISDSLVHPIGSKSLKEVALEKKGSKEHPTACIAVSDNTRPVPYKGDSGILLPVIETLLDAGYRAEDILVLVATGMHREMKEEELRNMIDERVFALGVQIKNHLPKDESRLTFVGTTKRGTKAMIDTLYMNADLKIATGLVESHFMAGVSGGRKTICPGLIGEESTYVFHGPALMADENARDLNLENNPVHEESLAVAKLAGVDFIVNVTLNHSFEVTGVFSGDLEKAHLAAVEKIRDVVEVPVPEKADIVLTNAGFVGINHYQFAKCGVASLGALKKDGYLVAIGNATDKGHVIGSANYRVTLALLHLLGSKDFVKLLVSPDWVFLPEQWQVQQWAKVFDRIPQDHYYEYAPQITHGYYQLQPGVEIRSLFDKGTDESDKGIYQVAIDKALEDISKKSGKKIEDMSIIYIAEGPYEIPRSQKE